MEPFLSAHVPRVRLSRASRGPCFVPPWFCLPVNYSFLYLLCFVLNARTDFEIAAHRCVKMAANPVAENVFGTIGENHLAASDFSA